MITENIPSWQAAQLFHSQIVSGPSQAWVPEHSERRHLGKLVASEKTSHKTFKSNSSMDLSLSCNACILKLNQGEETVERLQYDSSQPHFQALSFWLGNERAWKLGWTVL